MVLDDATFEKVVNAHYESLYRFAISLAQHDADAGDLTQETFAQLARKAHQVQDKAKLKSWLFTTLYRAFVDSKRWKTRHPHVEVEASDHELPVSQPEAADRIDAATARQALMQVDEVFRAPLVLFYLEEHSYLEIAEILGIPPGTVMSRISRGRAMLRRLMEDKPRNVIPLDTAKVTAVRTVVFSQGLINGKTMDMARVDVSTKVGATEIWEIENIVGMDHPFHLHGFQFQILDRDGVPERYRAWKDMINIPKHSTARIIVRYDDFPGKWMFHCHILDHEDHGMMGVLEVK